MSKMGSHDPFGHLQHKLWQKERSWVKIGNLTPDHKKSGIDPTSVCAGGVRYTVENFQWELQLCSKPHPNQSSEHEFITLQSCGSSNFGNFGTPSKVPKQRAIWMWASQRGAKYTKWRKVVASLESGPWWVLWIRGCLWFVLTLKVLQHYTNQLVVNLMQICVSE